MKRNKADSKKNEKLMQVLWLALLTALFILIYQLAIAFYLHFVIHIYIIAGSLLVIAYFVINGGFSAKMPEYDDLPEAWSLTEKKEFLEKLKNRKGIAKKLIYFIFPILITLLLDCLYVFFIAEHI